MFSSPLIVLTDKVTHTDRQTDKSDHKIYEGVTNNQEASIESNQRCTFLSEAFEM